LQRRAALDRIGGDESGFLNVLQEIAESGKCPAEEKLELYNSRWNRSVDPVFFEFAYWRIQKTEVRDQESGIRRVGADFLF
jgi:glutamate--cysteine ligase